MTRDMGLALARFRRSVHVPNVPVDDFILDHSVKTVVALEFRDNVTGTCNYYYTQIELKSTQK